MLLGTGCLKAVLSAVSPQSNGKSFLTLPMVWIIIPQPWEWILKNARWLIQILLEATLIGLFRQKAIDNAAAIKAKGIDIYTIGLGNVDKTYLESIASGPEFAFYTSDPDELEGIFQKIANTLKLVLIS